MSAAEHRQTILDALDQLPPLHEVAQKLIAVMDDENSSARDLDKLIRNDQAMTARILKAANSSAYGKSRDIFQLTEAVVLLGHGTISSMVLGVAMTDAVADTRSDEFAELAWEHSLDCGAVAQAVAEVSGYPDPEQAFVVGLMHDIGLLIQHHAVPEALRAALADPGEDALAAERLVMGVNHAQVGQKLLNTWCLPVPLCEAVRFHHAPHKKYKRTNPLVNIIALADQLTSIVGASPYPRPEGLDLFPLLRDVGIAANQFGNLFSALQQSRSTARALLAEADLKTAPTAQSGLDLGSHPPVALAGTDERRLAWFASLIGHFGLPLVDCGSVQEQAVHAAGTELILVDFHGASPAEREEIDAVVEQTGLMPVVLGDIRHTPPDAMWQSAPHLPNFFTAQELCAALAGAAGVTA